MDYAVIQEQIDRLCDAMLAKGLRQPNAQFDLRAHQDCRIYITWKPLKRSDVGLYESDRYEFFNDGSPGELITKAFAFVEALPSPEETKFREFMGALGGVIDLGKENGIEVEFLNPLVATMKRLSENALTYQVPA